MSERTTRLVGLFAVVAAALAVVVSPLLALAYFATGDGSEELEAATVSAWAEPAREVADGLLTSTSPDRLYGIYWLLFWVLFVPVFFCARAVHAGRPSSTGRLERWAWRMALVGYGLGAVGSLAAIAIIVEGTAENAVIDVAFIAVMIPALATDAVGSTLLGIALARGRYEPKVTAWLLILTLPSIVVLPAILGNLSFGLLPVFVAWAASGWRLWRAGTAARPQKATAHA